jgi:hypothetical protein
LVPGGEAPGVGHAPPPPGGPDPTEVGPSLAPGIETSIFWPACVLGRRETMQISALMTREVEIIDPEATL